MYKMISHIPACRSCPIPEIFPSNSILFARLHRLKHAIILTGMADNIDYSNQGNNVFSNALITLTSTRVNPDDHVLTRDEWQM